MKKKEEDFFRLLAIQENAGIVLIDKSFRTLKGARIAFTRQFRNMAFRNDLLPEWSYFYPPDKAWLEKKLSTAEN